MGNAKRFLGKKEQVDKPHLQAKVRSEKGTGLTGSGIGLSAKRDTRYENERQGLPTIKTCSLRRQFSHRSYRSTIKGKAARGGNGRALERALRMEGKYTNYSSVQRRNPFFGNNH
ncbi:hypothetical protein KP509_1Z263500 [Ceratopteris richardii]|nr:hypothetical protein KP509_1Z263500 [Ceratopteris richardii]